jgi:2-methylisocitrate lyase-like PEP mutase family enzyme
MFAAAARVAQAVQLPVTLDAEAGYGLPAGELVRRLLAVGAVGCNLEDTDHRAGGLRAAEAQAAWLAEVRSAADAAGVPLVINARVDALVRGGDWDDMVARANSYLEAGADVIFVLGLGTEDKVKRALDAIDGKISVISNPTSVPLKRLAELGVSRVSFGPGTLGLTLAHLQHTATQLTALGEYPAELGFAY